MSLVLDRHTPAPAPRFRFGTLSWAMLIVGALFGIVNVGNAWWTYQRPVTMFDLALTVIFVALALILAIPVRPAPKEEAA